MGLLENRKVRIPRNLRYTNVYYVLRMHSPLAPAIRKCKHLTDTLAYLLVFKHTPYGQDPANVEIGKSVARPCPNLTVSNFTKHKLDMVQS